MSVKARPSVQETLAPNLIPMIDIMILCVRNGIYKVECGAAQAEADGSTKTGSHAPARSS